VSVSTYDFDLDKQVIFNYKETDLPEGHFLHKFLVEFQIEKFEIIETQSSVLNLESTEITTTQREGAKQKIVIHDLIKDEFYKIYWGLEIPQDDREWNKWKHNHIFYNNASFPNNIINSFYSEENDWWILKSTRIPGEDIYNFLLQRDKELPFTMDNFLDSMLYTLKWYNTEGRQVFPKIQPSFIIADNLYLSIGEVDWISKNNMFYSSEKGFTKVDHEPTLTWVDKQQYMTQSIRSFIKLFADLMPYQGIPNIVEYVSEGKNIIKRIEHCIDYVETEIFV
tara:strand:- start:2578 stop:3420 length:843 start_codon:yes stop_codon:yes gene_type:complete